ncbi:MAG: lipid-binding SYLF domain-containing protein [Verrucomicrobiales bacterium]|nr:lipid-binding SYLF domain-containing protein [Verrucomicrobiales bacterium]
MTLHCARRLWLVIVLAVTGLGGLQGVASDRAIRKAEARLAEMEVLFEELQSDPARAIPPEVLREARGLIVLREKRAGLIVGGRSGTGFALVKRDGRWSWPAFVRATEGSLGLQAGYQKATLVHVLMTDAAVGAFQTNRFRFGVGLRVTSGPRTMGDDAKTGAVGADVLVYASTGGVFGGVAVEGGNLGADDDLNEAYYGKTAEALLFGAPPSASASPPEGAGRFRAWLEKQTRGTPDK